MYELLRKMDKIVLAWVRTTLQRMMQETVVVVELDREVSTTGYGITGH